MINAINELPYNQQQYGTFLVKNIIKSKRKLGLGNLTMDDLSNELNKPSIQKFERQKVIVNHINEIHSTDLVDMSQYSKINKVYKHIFTNIDIFSKIANAYPIRSKKYKILNLVLKKYLKIISQTLFGVIKNQHFYLKKYNNFSKITTLKFIIPTVI